MTEIVVGIAAGVFDVAEFGADCVEEGEGDVLRLEGGDPGIEIDVFVRGGGEGEGEVGEVEDEEREEVE